ncbi:MAG TPA: N-acetylmannosamine kinase [Ruminococcaceae bacterium]|nr:N-acetylmannosamine kinase [Oscillospiraceae bacterium]
MTQDLLNIIAGKMKDFSKGQRLIGDYIVKHYEKAAFMTASKLGNTVGVSESTVVRFASELGYDGYPQLQKALQEMIKNRLTTIQRMEVTNEQIGNNDVLSKVLNLDIEKIRRTLEETNTQSFNEAVENIVNAKNIYIIGIRSAASLASFISFYFNHIFENVKLVNTSSTSEMFEQIFRINKDDVMICISFPRYSKRTVSAAKFAKDCGARIIAITDSIASPLASVSDNLLLARSDMASFVDSLVAPLSLINALIVAVGLKKREEISCNYAKLEKIWDEYNVYEKADDGDGYGEKM